MRVTCDLKPYTGINRVEVIELPKKYSKPDKAYITDHFQKCVPLWYLTLRITNATNKAFYERIVLLQFYLNMATDLCKWELPKVEANAYWQLSPDEEAIWMAADDKYLCRLFLAMIGAKPRKPIVKDYDKRTEHYAKILWDAVATVGQTPVPDIEGEVVVVPPIRNKEVTILRQIAPLYRNDLLEKIKDSINYDNDVRAAISIPDLDVSESEVLNYIIIQCRNYLMTQKTRIAKGLPIQKMECKLTFDAILNFYRYTESTDKASKSREYREAFRLFATNNLRIIDYSTGCIYLRKAISMDVDSNRKTKTYEMSREITADSRITDLLCQYWSIKDMTQGYADGADVLQYRGNRRVMFSCVGLMGEMYMCALAGNIISEFDYNVVNARTLGALKEGAQWRRSLDRAANVLNLHIEDARTEKKDARTEKTWGKNKFMLKRNEDPQTPKKRRYSRDEDPDKDSVKNP